MTDRAKNILIGLFVTIAITIGVSMILFLEPQIGDGKKILRVRFANISGIVVGTRVTFAGKPVGEVVHIREIEDARSHPDEIGRIYFYELSLKTDSSVDIYAHDEIAVRSTGLMGERSVAILPKSSLGAKKITDQVIFANSTDPLENSFQQISKAAVKLEGLVTQCDHWFQQNSNSLSHLVSSCDQALVQAESFFQELNEQKIIPSFKETAELCNDNLELVRKTLSDDHLLSNLTSLVDQIDEAARLFNREGAPILNHLSQITQEIAEGNGSIAQIIQKEDLYLHLNSLLSKAETMMNDINHYGILFQYDKHWQRGRTKKANLLQALQTPKEFRSYFEGEIDAINTSIARIAELLQRSSHYEDESHVIQTEGFKKQFASLLRNVQSLADNIKLYNESIQTKDKF